MLKSTLHKACERICAVTLRTAGAVKDNGFQTRVRMIFKTFELRSSRLGCGSRKDELGKGEVTVFWSLKSLRLEDGCRSLGETLLECWSRIGLAGSDRLTDAPFKNRRWG